jgi:hypothetical protein
VAHSLLALPSCLRHITKLIGHTTTWTKNQRIVFGYLQEPYLYPADQVALRHGTYPRQVTPTEQNNPADFGYVCRKPTGDLHWTKTIRALRMGNRGWGPDGKYKSYEDRQSTILEALSERMLSDTHGCYSKWETRTASIAWSSITDLNPGIATYLSVDQI